MADSVDGQHGMRAMVRAFEERLSSAVPFREDVACLTDLLNEIHPVLEVLQQAYEANADPTSMHEAYALFSLLCRRAGLLGATPTASVAVVRATEDALREAAISLSAAQREQLLLIAVESYTAGRDEQRERAQRTMAAESQVWFALAPRCFGVFLAGSHHAEQLEPLLDQVARDLFRSDVRSALLDISRLRCAHEEQLRLLVGFVSTLASLGARVFVTGVSAEDRDIMQRLGLVSLGATVLDDPGEAYARTLQAAGYEVRSRRRLGDLLERVRAVTR